MKKFMMIAGVLSGLMSVAQADSLFRWVDSEGAVHYGDRPATDAVKVEPKKFTAPEVPDDGILPYQTRRAKQSFPVTLYVTERCGEPCMQARAFLNKRAIPFAEKVLGLKDENDEFRRISGSNVIPTLAIGKSFLKGFDSTQWGNELDFAGYPKEAYYGARPIQPAPQKEQEESSVQAE